MFISSIVIGSYGSRFVAIGIPALAAMNRYIKKEWNYIFCAHYFVFPWSILYLVSFLKPSGRSEWRRRTVLQAIGGGLLGLPSAGCSASELPSVSDLRQLRAADPQSGLVRLTQEGRAGVFRWHSGNYARAAAGDPLGGRHITSLSVSRQGYMD